MANLSELPYLPPSQQPLWFLLIARPLSRVFSSIYRCRLLAYRLGLCRVKRLPGYVISVGNIAVGGTGKSPVVMALVRELKAQGSLPAIVSRGYGAGLSKEDVMVMLGGQVVAANCSPRIPDEALMQSLALPNVPIAIGAVRSKAAQFLLDHIEATPTHWVLDDGFQHWRLHRDVDIVLVDGVQGVGNGSMLPAGFLREPVTALGRASIIFLTLPPGTVHCDPKVHKVFDTLPTKPRVHTLRFETAEPVQVSGPSISLRSYQGNVLAYAGIARPERFFSSLKQWGINRYKKLVTGDHVAVSSLELTQSMQGAGEWLILTTEKDYARHRDDWSTLNVPIFVLPLKVKVDTDFWEALRRIMPPFQF